MYILFVYILFVLAWASDKELFGCRSLHRWRGGSNTKPCPDCTRVTKDPELASVPSLFFLLLPVLILLLLLLPLSTQRIAGWHRITEKHEIGT